MTHSHGLAWNVIRSSGSFKFWHNGLNFVDTSRTFLSNRQHDYTAEARIQQRRTPTVTAIAQVYNYRIVHRARKHHAGLTWLPLTTSGAVKYWHAGSGFHALARNVHQSYTADARIQQTQHPEYPGVARVQVPRLTEYDAIARVQQTISEAYGAIGSIAHTRHKLYEALARIQTAEGVEYGAVARLWGLPPEGRTARVYARNRRLIVPPDVRLSTPLANAVEVPADARTLWVRYEDRTINIGMSKGTRLYKDADATLDYSVDWSQWLNSGDTIDSVEWIAPAGLELESQSNSGTVAVVVLSGGTLGKVYSITCRVTTTGGLTDDYSFELQVVNK